LGSAAAKDRLLRELFARATEEEQDFLLRLLIGELRQGALEGLMVAAVARATALDPDGVRRAAMLAGGLGPVARAALTDGAAGRDLPHSILAGDARALQPDGTPLPFQVTMRRFGRKLDVERLRAELPLSAFFFDVLYADGTVLLGEPYTARFAVLERVVPPERRVPRIVTRDALLAGRFIEQAIAAGHEGLMAKALATRYDAGARGAAWLKVK